MIYSLRFLVFYVIRSALAERYLKWTSGDNAFIFVDRSAKAERKSKEYRQKLDNINKDQVWQLTSNGQLSLQYTRVTFYVKKVTILEKDHDNLEWKSRDYPLLFVQIRSQTGTIVVIEPTDVVGCSATCPVILWNIQSRNSLGFLTSLFRSFNNDALENTVQSSFSVPKLSWAWPKRW